MLLMMMNLQNNFSLEQPLLAYNPYATINNNFNF